MTATDVTVRRHEIIRAALAEAGADPAAVSLRDGLLYWHPYLADGETVWRAYEIARHATGVSPLCRACCDKQGRTGRFVTDCEATRPFVTDCGTDR